MTLQNISIDTGIIRLSEEVIAKTTNIIFPGNDHINTLISIFVWFITGLVTLGVFFYFSKKYKMFKTMTWLEKSIFSIFFGAISFMIIIFAYLPFVFLGYDPLGFMSTGSMLPFMILSGFLLFGCLSLASTQINGRKFLIRTYNWLEAIFIVFVMTFMASVLTYKTHNYLLLSWIIVDIIYFIYRIKPILRKT